MKIEIKEVSNDFFDVKAVNNLFVAILLGVTWLI